MANGTTHREIARADRLRERHKQDQKATRNAINNLRELPPREEMDSGEIDLAKLGVKAKGIPPRALGAVIIILAAGGVIAGIIKLLVMK
jgi:hypothetical protein